MASYLNAYADGPNLYLVRRTRGAVTVERTLAEYVSWYRAAEVSADLLRLLRTSGAVKSVKVQGEWLRVGWRDERTRRAMVGSQEDGPLAGVEAFEGDVDPVLLWMIENGAEVARPRRAYLDLETDSDKSFAEARRGEARILSWSVTDDDGLRRCNVLEEDTDVAEHALAMSLWKLLGSYDQVVAWNLDGFDAPVLWGRTQHLRIKTDPRRWLWCDHRAVFQRLNMHAAKSGDEKQSMKLEDIAQAVLKRGKISDPGIVPGKVLGAQTREMWDAGGEWRAKMVRYNVVDAELLRDIEKETGYLALFDTLCEACRVFGNTEGLNPTAQLDSFLLRLGHERGQRFPTRAHVEKEGYKGAYVMHPKRKGILRNVHVADFSSMYPSIILTWNMSPESREAIPVNGPIPDGYARAPTTGIGFNLGIVGILVDALRELLRLRKYWSDRKAQCAPGTPEWHDADRRSTAYKVAANAFYGVVGSIFSRFFNKAIASSVTGTGEWLLKQIISAVDAKAGWESVYGDTDSALVIGPSDEEFTAFVEWCNAELIPGLVAKQGCRENHVKIAYEKKFERIVIVTAKRYCARFSHYKGTPATEDSEPEVKGLEYKRGDAGVLARRLQAEVIDLLVGGLKVARVPVPTERLEDYHDAVSRMREHVLNGPLSAKEVVLSKSLSRGLGGYAQKIKKDGKLAAQPAHVVVAKMLKERGRTLEEGDRVEYVVSDATADPTGLIPAEDYNGTNVDRFHLWESIVFPPTQRLLEAAFPDLDWEAWRKVRPKKERATKVLTEMVTAQAELFSLGVPAQKKKRKAAGA